jgi:hypothetical protein
MTRAAAVLLVLTGAAPAPGAPALKHKDPAPYYPTAVGYRWTYDGTNGANSFVVTGVEPKDGALLVDVANVGPDGHQNPCQRMRVGPDGVFRVSLAGRDYPTPECLLKLPHKDGQEWEFDLGTGGGKARLTAVRRETVETPAGKFDCIRVERTGASAATYWFAERVGLVKVTSGKFEQTLKSFTPGKKE